MILPTMIDKKKLELEKLKVEHENLCNKIVATEIIIKTKNKELEEKQKKYNLLPDLSTLEKQKQYHEFTQSSQYMYYNNQQLMQPQQIYCQPSQIINTNNTNIFPPNSNLCTIPKYCKFYALDICSNEHVKTGEYCDHGLHLKVMENECSYYFCKTFCKNCKSKDHPQYIDGSRHKLCYNFVFYGICNITCYYRHAFTNYEKNKLQEADMCANKIYDGECNDKECIESNHSIKPIANYQNI